MDFEKVGGDQAVGTHLQGHLTASYDNLVKVFGEPTLVGSDKARVEWLLKYNGRVITIYDWKNDMPIKEVTDWHIGGKSHQVVYDVISAFNIKDIPCYGRPNR